MTSTQPIGATSQFTSIVPDNNITILYDNITSTSTIAADYLDEKLFTDFTEYKAAAFINRYYLYAVCAIGIPGNIACIVTLLFMRPMVSSAVYMTTLAIVDTIAITLKMVYFQLTANDVQFGDTGCQLTFLIGTVSQQYSNWILVAMTIERFIAIWFPLKVKTFCTKRKAIMIMAIMLVFFTLANLQFVFTFQEIKDPYLSWDCRAKLEYSDFVQYIWYWIDGALYAMLPILVILILNGLIVWAVRKSGRTQRNLTNRTTNINDKITQQRQITMMLLTISIVFVILVLPNCIFFIARKYWSWEETMQGVAQYFLIYQVVFLLSDFNHAVNFYLYCLSGRKFRQKFVQLTCCRRRNASQNYSSYFSNTRIHGKTSVTSLNKGLSINNNNCEIQADQRSLGNSDGHM